MWYFGTSVLDTYQNLKLFLIETFPVVSIFSTFMVKCRMTKHPLRLFSKYPDLVKVSICLLYVYYRARQIFSIQMHHACNF